MLSIFKIRYIKHVFFISVATGLLYLAIFHLVPITEGDGPSYLLTLWALSDHQSPDIRTEDAFRLDYFFPAEAFNAVASSIQNDEPNAGWILHRNKDGDYYDHHFCFYALIALPVKSVLTSYNANQAASFQITNSLIIILGLCYLLYFSTLLPIQRMAMSLLYLFEGILFYLRWPHPEILIATAVFLSAVAIIEKRKHLSILFASIGALQNPVVCLFIPIIFLYNASDWLKLDLKHKILELSKATLFTLVSTIPFVFYYIKFGKISLAPVSISNVGFNINKLFSFFFDLNQGLILGMPAILIASIFILFCSLIVLIKWSRPVVCKLLNDVNFDYKSILLVVASLLMAWGTTILTNWNSGQSVFIRYAVWAGAPLVVYLVINLAKFKKWLFIVLCIIAIQVFNTCINHAYYAENGEFIMSQTSKFVLNHYPSIYNPEPEIFIERTLGAAVSTDTRTTIVDTPVVYRDGEGFIRKIAFRETAIPVFDDSVCGVDKRLISVDRRPADVTKAHKADEGYFYLSGKFNCE